MDSGTRRLLAALLTYSDNWGMVWFGLVFWGSVINAIAVRYLPGTDQATVALAAYAAGLAIGILARIRGGWL